MSLGGFETAVRFLTEEEWPKAGEGRVLLKLYYAQSLITYQRSYSWEIREREKVAHQGTIDLKSLTTAEIGLEIRRTLDSIMGETAILIQPLPDSFKPYLSGSTFPAEVKPTLRDSVLDLASEHFLDTSFWTPEQSNEVFRLPLGKLAATTKAMRLPAVSSTAHPVEILVSWLGENIEFHRSRREEQAQLESNYALLAALSRSVSESADKELVKAELVRLQKQQRANPWWSRGQALLAEMTKEQQFPGRLIEALTYADEGAKAYPKSMGAALCESIARDIKSPRYSVGAMKADGPQKNSFAVSYRNLNRLYFRAYPLSLSAALPGLGGRIWQLDEKARKLLSSKPTSEWTFDLPKTSDFTEHRALVTPPFSKPGMYRIFVSTKPNFETSDNEIHTFVFSISDLVIATEPADGAFEMRVFSGQDGKPVAGATVALYRFTYDGPTERHSEKTTDGEGAVVFAAPEVVKNKYFQYFAVAQKGGDLSFSADNLYFNKFGTSMPFKTALFFTDRSIYRPGQKILFKIAAYEGQSRKADFHPIQKGQSLRIALRDPNYQEVANLNVTTNDFGTASGEFIIPEGRPLGAWSLSSSIPGTTTIRIEEYKRPTFDVEWVEAKAPLRLNQKAVVQGQARYYFGQPVTAGTVRWRVTRQEVWPWWWEYRAWGRGGSRPQRSNAQTIATGQTTVNREGQFSIEFIPSADERQTKTNEGLSYSYTLAADLTDEGGETRSATRAYRIGFVGVETIINLPQGFYRTSAPFEISANLHQLDGKPRKGSGDFRIVRLKAPTETALPADLPREVYLSAGEKYSTPDDLKRARYETGYQWQKITGTWPDGDLFERGKMLHNERGDAKLNLKAPTQPGAYRIYYETKDDFGATFKVFSDFIVANPNPQLPLPLVLIAENQIVSVGSMARVLVHAGYARQPITVEIFRSGRRESRKTVISNKDASIFEIPIHEADRGGFSIVAYTIRDHQAMRAETHITVPWDDRELKVHFSTFRDKMRPGAKENFKVTIKNAKGQPLTAGTAEILALMYDRSLDLFAPHQIEDFNSIYPQFTQALSQTFALGQEASRRVDGTFRYFAGPGSLRPNKLEIYSGYSTGGPGERRLYKSKGVLADSSEAEKVSFGALEAAAPASASVGRRGREEAKANLSEMAANGPAAQSRESSGRADSPNLSGEVRTQFSETAFFKPHLLTEKDGSVSIEFEVPDSITSWKIMAMAMTRDFRSGLALKQAETVKELMVRPYVPRFLREGDQAEIRVTVNNASDGALKGELNFDIHNAETQVSALEEFGLSKNDTLRGFQVAKGASTTLSFSVRTPKKVGAYSFRVTGRSNNFSDGELRPFPVLPSRMHLTQSRFVTLKDKSTKTLEFKDLSAQTDKSLIHEKLVVSVDAQLFYGVLAALPYLVTYPYECSEQTMNRFLATGILTSLYKKYPAIAEMTKKMSLRETKLARVDEPDANRKMALEETPWLLASQGGKTQTPEDLVNVLNENIAKTERDRSIARLRKMQLSSGAFPWFEGGPADIYMTAYLLMGFARAAEFRVDIPKDMVVKAWGYLHQHINADLKPMMSRNCCWEEVTLINYVLSSFQDASWSGNLFDQNLRTMMLEYSFAHWKSHSPLLKGYLALTLKRMNRVSDSALVWDSVMDSAKTTEELGTYWAPEDRSWLWYNDTIESHAFSLRTLMELKPNDKRNEGLVQWLFLNKKLNHWKSTRATSEVIYSLAKYLDSIAGLGQKEELRVDLGTQKTQFIFDPKIYSGNKNQVVIEGPKISPANAKIVVEKSTPGFAFASASWHFSTDLLPTEGESDFLGVSRKYFVRDSSGKEVVLRALADGAKVRVGDQIEVHLSLKAKHEAEYVHLRDPRAAGLEPESQVSGYKWDLGLSWFEEIRDSGTNFFFSRLPVGEYTFKYRVRASMAGTFRMGPATLQSVYAPEFNAYSAGYEIKILPPAQ